MDWIDAITSVNEQSGVRYKTRFYIVEKLPEIGEDLNYGDDSIDEIVTICTTSFIDIDDEGNEVVQEGKRICGIVRERNVIPA